MNRSIYNIHYHHCNIIFLIHYIWYIFGGYPLEVVEIIIFFFGFLFFHIPDSTIMNYSSIDIV